MSRLSQDQARVMEVVCATLVELKGEVSPAGIGPQTSLVADLGFDSISLVEAAAAIEQALGIRELPLLAWTDHEADREGERFTVASLVGFCLERGIPAG